MKQIKILKKYVKHHIITYSIPCKWLEPFQMVLEIKRSYYSLLTIAGDDMASPALNNSKLILKRKTKRQIMKSF